MERIILIIAVIAGLFTISCLKTDNPFSPNSSIMAFGKSQYMFYWTQSTLYRARISDGGDVRVVFRTNQFYYSPGIANMVMWDKSEKYFYTFGAKSSTSTTNAYRYNIDGTGETLIVSGTSQMYPAVAAVMADGDLIVMERTSTGTSYYSYSASGVRGSLITTNGFGRFTPYGNTIFWTSENISGTGPYTNDVVIGKYDNTSKTITVLCTVQLIDANQMHYFPLTSPDGSQIILPLKYAASNTITCFLLSTAAPNTPRYFASVSTNGGVNILEWGPYKLPAYGKYNGSYHTETGFVSISDGALIRTKSWTSSVTNYGGAIDCCFRSYFTTSTNLDNPGPGIDRY